MIDKKLQEAVGNIVAKGQITFGDVRRLQRGCLPTGTSIRDELETLISLNAKVARADEAWAQWLVPAVVDFVASGQGSEPSIEEPAGQWLDGLLAASSTSLGRRIARQIRRELARQRAPDPTLPMQHHRERARGRDVSRSLHAAVPEHRFSTVWSEMMLGPSYRAAVQVTSARISLAA